jgi:hypothetical protein
MDSPWGDDPLIATSNSWSTMEAVFTDAGYREGITAGKERTLQAGFDGGFACVGAPIGHELGILRGIASALLPFVISHSSNRPDWEPLVNEVRHIASLLTDIRFADIAPQDVEAEEHAQEHLIVGGGLEVNEEVAAGTRVGQPEGILSTLATGPSTGVIQSGKPTMDDVRQMKKQLGHLTGRLGLSINLIWPDTLYLCLETD